jgi:uncharacterized membrane protein YhaH (DUF805 family)
MDWRHLFFGFDGRISRAPYWIAMVVLLAAELLSFSYGYGRGDPRLSALFELALLYPEAAVLFKRAHDRNMPDIVVIIYVVLSMALDGLTVFELDGTPERPSGLYWLATLPCFAIALYLFVELGFRRGVSGPNQYGPDPLQGSKD